MSDEPVKVEDQQVIGEDAKAAQAATRQEAEQKKALADFGKHDKDKAKMRVHVHSPYRDYYNGLAYSISAKNATGPFDILPRHHNFISLLPACEIIIRTVSEGDRKIRISGGIIHVKADQVIVFLDV
jgi:hypothetical protein